MGVLTCVILTLSDLGQGQIAFHPKDGEPAACRRALLGKKGDGRRRWFRYSESNRPNHVPQKRPYK